MSKELKAPDKVTQKMTRDGAVAENLTTGETSSISERPQEENYSAPAGVAAEKVVQHIGAEIERHAAKGAEKKALDATQPKTHSSRLQFSEAERATPELQKAIKKSDKAADCLDAARAAIPKQTKIKKERVFDEAKGKAKTRLSFEKTDKPPNGKLRHNPLSRPAQELNSTVHGKIYEVEKENVGVESGHRVELAGEKAGGMAARAVKGGIRRHKLKPYRAAAAAEKQAVKANADFLYQKALHDNPALAHSNPISRFWQKQRIKKQYAKTLKAGGKAKKTAEATAKAAKKTAQETKRATFFVVRHWKGCLIVGGIAFIVLLLFGGLSSCSLFGGNSGSGLIASSYLSEDADITGAEHPHTYQFIEIINQWLAEHGMPQITVVQYVDRYGNRLSLETECLRSHTLPSIAYGHKRCSQKHKIAPQEKFCNHYAPCREVWQRGEKVNRYIGYDAGEVKRYEHSRKYNEADKKYHNRYPLIEEWGWNRDDCIREIKAAGLPQPGKSSCFFCPSMKKQEILYLKEHYPDLFNRAATLEENAMPYLKTVKGLGRSYSWKEQFGKE